jgi:hypothetical protein
VRWWLWQGTKSGWKAPNEIRPLPEDRREWRNTNFVGDIVGAQADTVVHSIRTDRHVNPLNPTYLSLDGEPFSPMHALWEPVGQHVSPSFEWLRRSWILKIELGMNIIQTSTVSPHAL